MYQTEAIQTWLNIFLEPGQVTELRALAVEGRRAVSLVTADLAALAERAAELDGAGARGCYFIPNPLRPDLVGSRASARKADVDRRHWLLIDVDPVRAEGHDKDPADEAERTVAWTVLDSCRGILEGIGLTGAVVGDSGNGWHLCFPIDLPADDAAQELVKGVLHCLHAVCSQDGAKVDTSTHDAPRIWKLYGTHARKGIDQPDRPHRLAWLVKGEPWSLAVAEANTALLPGVVDRLRFVIDTRRGRPQLTNESYAAAALESEIRKLAGTTSGSRNQQLFRSAVTLFELVKAGALDRGDVVRELESACRQNGHDGDFKATIKSAWGKAAPRDLSGVGSTPAAAAIDESDPEPTVRTGPITEEDIATIDDLIEQGSRIEWLWPGWIQRGVLAVIAGFPGKGKTRFCADLVRRIRHGLPWPDGEPPTVPETSRVIWVASDNHHDELVSLSQAFEMKEAIRLNASKKDPYGGVILDTPQQLNELEARIKAINPVLVIIDTVGNATDRNLSKQEEAKQFYQPLQVMARRQRVAILCLTHLSAEGHTLGRRVLEKVRVAIKVDQPEGQERRKVQVYKSNSKYPPALGVTMGDHGNEYDHNPPEDKPQGFVSKGGRPADPRAKTWLAGWLATGPKRVSITRNEAENFEDIPAGQLYRAMRELQVTEYAESGKKWWKLPEQSVVQNSENGNGFGQPKTEDW